MRHCNTAWMPCKGCDVGSLGKVVNRMEEEKLKVDCTKHVEKGFSVKFRILLYTALVLTGMMTLLGIMMLIGMLATLSDGIELQGRANEFYWQFVFWISISLSFFVLMKIRKSKKPFSGRMIKCFYTIGVMFMAGAVIFPFLPNYSEPGFVLLGDVFFKGMFIDGWPFLGGLILTLLTGVLKCGLEYQAEIDTMI